MSARTRSGQFALALAVLTMAGVLLALVTPRLRASLHYLPVDTAIARYWDSGEIPTAQLPALAARAREAIALYPHYRYWDGLSFVEYLRALDPETRAWLVRPALHRSMSAGLEAVRRAPAEPRTWLRVAQVRAVLGEDDATVAAALEMSILTGRVEPTLLLPRLELGYAYVDRFDDSTLDLLRDQTVLAWRVNERGFRQALRGGRLDLVRVKSVLGERYPDIVNAMEAAT